MSGTFSGAATILEETAFRLLCAIFFLTGMGVKN